MFLKIVVLCKVKRCSEAWLNQILSWKGFGGVKVVKNAHFLIYNVLLDYNVLAGFHDNIPFSLHEHLSNYYATPQHASWANLQGDTPARFIGLLTRGHTCTRREATY